MTIILTIILGIQLVIWYLLITYTMEIRLADTYANERMRQIEKLIKEL